MAYQPPQVDGAGAFLAGFDRGERLAKETLAIFQDREYKKAAEQAGQEVQAITSQLSTASSEAEQQARDGLMSYENKLKLGEDPSPEEDAQAKAYGRMIAVSQKDKVISGMDQLMKLKLQHPSNPYVAKMVDDGVNTYQQQVAALQHFAQMEMQERQYELDQQKLKLDQENAPLKLQEAQRQHVRENQGTVEEQTLASGRTVLVEKEPATGQVRVVPEAQGSTKAAEKRAAALDEKVAAGRKKLALLDEADVLIDKRTPGTWGKVMDIAAKGSGGVIAGKQGAATGRLESISAGLTLENMQELKGPASEREWDNIMKISGDPRENTPEAQKAINERIRRAVKFDLRVYELQESEGLSYGSAARQAQEEGFTLGGADIPLSGEGSAPAAAGAPEGMPEGSVLKVHPRLGKIWVAPDGTARKAE